MKTKQQKSRVPSIMEQAVAAFESAVTADQIKDAANTFSDARHGEPERSRSYICACLLKLTARMAEMKNNADTAKCAKERIAANMEFFDCAEVHHYIVKILM